VLVLVVTAVQAEADAVAGGLGDALRPRADAPPAAHHAAPGDRGEIPGRRVRREAAPDSSSQAVALPGHTLRRLRLPAAAAARVPSAQAPPPRAGRSGVTAGPARGCIGSSVRGAGRLAAGAGPSAPGASVVDVLAAGVGPAAAAAGTSAALTAGALMGATYDLVVSAGIGGGFPAAAPVGAVVVADAIIAADLGAETSDGFVPIDALGFGRSAHLPPAGQARRMAEALVRAGRPAVHAPVLTVSTVTGSAEGAAELLARYPRAAAEAMEGFGVAEAAAAQGVPVLEIRAVSNAVGPRDRSAWRIGQALDSLRHAFHLLALILEEESR
jgi:futalosine hydrolase